MELQNEVSNDKTSVMTDVIQPNKLSSLEQQAEVDRTRKILLILISTLLVLCFINFVFVIHLYVTNNSFDGQSLNSSSQLVSVLTSIIYYGFGFLVTYRCYQTGLLVFAWLGFVSLLLILVIVINILIGIIITSSHLGFVNGIIVAIIFIIICLTTSLLQIFTVRHAFVLSKLLKNTKHLTIEQIQIP